MRNVIVATVALAAAGFVMPASAAPLAPANPAADATSPVTHVQGYRYRKDCYWTGSGWGYRHRGKVLVCRPYKPRGAGWVWYSEGPRHGWYNRRAKRWHHHW
ncbi:MAG: hypothetical protein R3D44_10700 [Hyphomicrobiaceae bacterium]